MTLARAILDPETLPTSGRPWDLFTLGLLAALFVFMPAAFGAVEAWSELVVIAGAVVLAVCLAIRPIFDREFRSARTWAWLPLALFIALVAFQLVPLPAGIAGLLAPGTLATKTQLLDEAGGARPITLSFYSRTTVEHLRLVLVGTVVFATVASVFRRPKQIKELLLVIFAIGCAQAVLAIAQIATGARANYWATPTVAGRLVTSGSFINYSHFCQFMNLSLAAGVAYLLVQLQEQRRSSIHGGFGRRLLAQLNWEKNGWILCGIMLSAISVFTSMGRNGVLSLLTASVVVGTLLYRRGSLSWRGWALALVPLGVLVALLLFGFDTVYERLATLRDASAYRGRWELTADTLRAWAAFPIWGTGLGTHQYVFPMFDSSVLPVLAEHADNDYAQLLEETGLLGGLFVAAFVVAIGTLAATLMLRGRTPVSHAAFGLALGLIAVGIHSATDFGQRLPANFALTATFCGLLVSISRIESRERLVRRGKVEVTSAAPAFARYGLAAASLVAVVAIGGWALTGAYATYLGEQWWAAALRTESRIARSTNPPIEQDYIDLLTAAEGAFRSDPANVDYGYWLNEYRWQSLSSAVNANTGRVTLSAEAVPYVAQIAAALAEVRQLCPTYGPPYALEGQLRLFVLKEPRGAEMIRTALRLSPYDPPTCLVAGELALREGRLAEAEPLLARAVDLRPDYFATVARLYLETVKQPELARKLAGDDYWRLSQLTNIASQNPELAGLVEELRADTIRSLRQHAEAGAAQPRELASLAAIDQQQGDLKSAAALYRRALAQEYNQVDWRMNLARILAADGRVDEAMHEVRICLRLRREYPPAVELLKQLNVPPK